MSLRSALDELESRCERASEDEGKDEYEKQSDASSVRRGAAMVRMQLGFVSNMTSDEEVQRTLALLHRAETSIDGDAYPEIRENIHEIRSETVREHAHRFRSE